MAVIKDGNGGTAQMGVDSTSTAARVSLYDTFGNPIQQYPLFSATGTVVSAAGTAPFFAIYGSSSKTIRIKSIETSGVTLTAVEYNTIVASKYSSAITGGTSTDLTKVPFDSLNTSTVSLLKTYTAAPTPGTSVGEVYRKRILLQSTTAAAGGTPEITVFNNPVLLRGIGEGICLAWGASPGSAATLAITVIWEEM